MVIRSAQDREPQSQDGEQPPRPGRALLQRSRTQRMAGGVLGGFAENWQIDVSLVRIGFLLLSLLTHFILGIVVYLAMWILLPEAPAKKV
ncbi:PspC domain-containing protein [candidate division KSB1 bacterium]|nr:PspC domain-containing protein [candidate division KSB1 bacterium]